MLGALNRSGLEAAGTHAPLLLRRHKTAGFQHADVFHQAWQRHIERMRKLPYRRLSLREPRDDRAPGGIGQRAEDMIEAG